MTSVTRRMTLADVEQVAEIDRASFSLPWPPRAFQTELTDNPSSRSWVVELDGKIIGAIVIWMILDEAHIATVAIHPEHRRQGIGERLLKHALESAKEEGAVRAFLEVRESNISAQAMYKKLGFVEDGRRARYYKDNNEDAILMSLNGLP